MTALLELKQKIKNLYGQYEIYILPVLRCILAFLYFTWINVNMGYMSQLNNIFIVLILALICSILPSGVMIFAGFALMIAHGYALGAEVAGFPGGVSTAGAVYWEQNLYSRRKLP
mgnify:CR=1 FL=1